MGHHHLSTICTFDLTFCCFWLTNKMQINVREVKGITCTQQEITCTNHVDIVRKQMPPQACYNFSNLAFTARKLGCLLHILKTLKAINIILYKTFVS